MAIGMTSTSERVTRYTDERINRLIERRIAANVAYFSAHPELIAQRLAELDEEWDIERAIQTNAAAVSLCGFMLAARRGAGFLAIPAMVSVFLLQHALQGWCPPVPILRRLGFRTAREIERERTALKALRGDFESVGGTEEATRARAALAATSSSSGKPITSPSLAP